jgi:hypothetical protein
VRRAIAEWLVSHNRDWAAAAREDARALDFEVRPSGHGEGVFAVNADRIKRRYVVTTSASVPGQRPAHHEEPSR